MDAVIVTAFYDTPENERAETSIRVAKHQMEVVDPRHQLVWVNNGSTDLSAAEWLQKQDRIMYLDAGGRHQVCYGLNTGWKPFEKQFLSGELISAKWDSGVEIDGDFEDVLDFVENTPDCGIVSPCIEPIEDEFEDRLWVLGCIHVRSVKYFQTVGYSKSPHSEFWGWEDLLDCSRATIAGLKNYVVGSVSLSRIYEKPCIDPNLRESIHTSGRPMIEEAIKRIRNGEEDLFVEFPWK